MLDSVQIIRALLPLIRTAVKYKCHGPPEVGIRNPKTVSRRKAEILKVTCLALALRPAARCSPLATRHSLNIADSRADDLVGSGQTSQHLADAVFAQGA